MRRRGSSRENVNVNAPERNINTSVLSVGGGEGNELEADKNVPRKKTA